MPQPDGQYLPVFVFPNQLTFYIRDHQSHRQVITIYNPYDFPVNYEILSTAPSNYSVQEPQGVLKPRCCVDIAIRIIELHQRGTEEKFRVVLRRRSGRMNVQGYRDVPSLVFDHRTDAESSSPAAGQLSFGNDFRGFVGSSGAGESSGIGERHGSSSTSSIHGASHQYPLPGGWRSGRPSWLLVIVGVLCIVCLSAPSIGDGGGTGEDRTGVVSYFPEWFHLGVSQKLVAAYVLGLITAAFLQA